MPGPKLGGPKLASLSSGLLARKGAARPAMRPQGFGFAPAPEASLEDLGWNDMGHVAPAAPVPAAAAETVARDLPPVLVEREVLAQALEVPAEVRSVSIPTATRLRRETSHAGKAALTLRLDADRHLRLRLAGAITNRSAQDLMIQSLDALIAALPTVDALVAALPAVKPAKR